MLLLVNDVLHLLIVLNAGHELILVQADWRGTHIRPKRQLFSRVSLDIKGCLLRFRDWLAVQNLFDWIASVESEVQLRGLYRIS